MKKKYYIITGGVFFFAILVIAFFSFRSGVHYIPLVDDSWRKLIHYSTVSRLSEEQRMEIFRQIAVQAKTTESLQTSMESVAKKNRLDIKDVREIVGEALSKNWEQSAKEKTGSQ
jgi:hypothetical protein